MEKNTWKICKRSDARNLRALQHVRYTILIIHEPMNVGQCTAYAKVWTSPLQATGKLFTCIVNVSLSFDFTFNYLALMMVQFNQIKQTVRLDNKIIFVFNIQTTTCKI